MVGIRNIHLGYLDGPLDRVFLTDFLKDAGEGASKFHGVRVDLPDRGIIHTWFPIVGLCQLVQDEPWPLVILGNRRNLGQIKVFPE